MRSRLALLSVVALCLALAPAPTPASARAEPACTILGTPGPDVLVGTSGPDVICGRGGDDVLRGLGGNDVLRGGRGGDDLLDRTARLRDGGPGPDWCPGAGRRVSCVNEDTVPAHVTKYSVNPGVLQLAEDVEAVYIQVTVQDDVGVRRVAMRLSSGRVSLPLQGDSPVARRRSGTAREGVYALKILVPPHVEAGGYALRVRITPREGAGTTFVAPDVTIVTDLPDVTPPVLADVTRPAPGATFALDQKPVVRLRATDELAGARAATVCYALLASPTELSCDAAVVVTDDLANRVFRTRLRHLDDLGVGAAELSITVYDDAGNMSEWFGPSHAGEPGVNLIPGGVGAFTVVP